VIWVKNNLFVWFHGFVVMIEGKHFWWRFGWKFGINYWFYYFSETFFLNILFRLSRLGKQRFGKCLNGFGNVGHRVDKELAYSFWAKIYDCRVLRRVIKIVRVREIFRFFFHKAKDNCDCPFLEEKVLKQFKVANDALVESFEPWWYCGFGIGLRL
jgi:hypothetical protein